MLDARVRRVIDPPLDRLGVALAVRGVGADFLTWSGFLLGVMAFVALAFQAYGIALTLVLLNRVADGLDGPVARAAGATDRGAFLDIVLDFIFYAGVPMAFALGRPEMALPALVLVFSFVGTMASFLAYAALAAKRGETTQAQGRKGLYYLQGAAEGTETILFLVAICIFPGAFDWLAYGFAALCTLTTVGRIAAGLRRFSAPPEAAGARPDDKLSDASADPNRGVDIRSPHAIHGGPTDRSGP